MSFGRNFIQRSKEDWNDFKNKITSFLSIYKEAVWVCVGESSIEFESDFDLNRLICDRKILIIENEEDLMALYELCDIFLMPPIGGGGRGIGLAASSGLPCLTMSYGDGAKSLPSLAVCNSIDEMFLSLEKIYKDDDFCDSLSASCKIVFGDELYKKSAHDMFKSAVKANANFLSSNNKANNQ